MRENIAEIQYLTDSVDGFLSQNGKNMHEGEVLYHLARRCGRNGMIAEIGSWKGKSTIWLGKGAQLSQNTVYAIDHHIGSPEHRKGGTEVWTFDEFKENISRANLSKCVIPLLMQSKEATGKINEKLNLLFIDGAHEFEAVKADFDLFIPKMKKGGVIAFHDSFRWRWPGVRKLVHKEVFRSPNFSKVRYIDSITYAVVTERATFGERIGNYWALLVKCLHEAQDRFPQPFRSFIKRLTWDRCRRKWLKELEQ